MLLSTQSKTLVLSWYLLFVVFIFNTLRRSETSFAVDIWTVVNVPAYLLIRLGLEW